MKKRYIIITVFIIYLFLKVEDVKKRDDLIKYTVSYIDNEEEVSSFGETMFLYLINEFNEVEKVVYQIPNQLNREELVELKINLLTKNVNMLPLMYRSPLILSAECNSIEIVENILYIDFDKPYMNLKSTNMFIKNFENLEFEKVIITINGS